MWKRVKNKDKVRLLFPRVAADIVLLPKASAVSAAVSTSHSSIGTWGRGHVPDPVMWHALPLCLMPYMVAMADRYCSGPGWYRHRLGFAWTA